MAGFITSVKELEVYKKAYALSLHVHSVSLEFPKYEQYSLTDQFRRAVRSICANIAEGFGKQRFSKAEFKRFLSMAIGSVVEAGVWNDRSKDLGYVVLKTHNHIEAELGALEQMLYKLHAKVQ